MRRVEHEAQLRCPPETEETQSRDTWAIEVSCEGSTGVRHGPYRVTDEHSVIEGAYEDGLAHGAFTESSLDGRPLGTYRLEHGGGTVVTHYATGALRFEGEYQHGLRNGHARYLRADGIVLRTEEWSQNTLLTSAGTADENGDIDQPDACDLHGEAESGCPDPFVCELEGRELTYRQMQTTSAGVLEMQRFAGRVALSIAARVTVHVEAPLIFDATIPFDDVELRNRPMWTLQSGEGFVRLGRSRRVHVGPATPLGYTWTVDVAPGNRLSLGHLRCGDLTLTESADPQPLEEFRERLVRARVSAIPIALGWNSSTQVVLSGEHDRPPTFVFSVRGERLIAGRTVLHIVTQQWDWTAISGWVPAELMEPVLDPAEHDSSSEHASVADQEDCDASPNERLVELPAGTSITSGVDGQRWARLTQPMSAVVRDVASHWFSIRRLASVRRAEQPCAPLIGFFARRSE